MPEEIECFDPDPINLKAKQIWEEESSKTSGIKTEYAPMIYPFLKKKAILFVGLNPSFSEKGNRLILKDSEYQNIDPSIYFNWKNRINLYNELEKAKKIEILARNKYPYFNKFKEISNEIQLEWEHIDLFMYRQKSQNEFKSVIGNKDDLNEFGKKQLALCHELILELEPRVMVVVNAFASNLIAKTWFLKEEFSEEIGTYICTLNDKKVPLFFSSMVSGQRALDNHSLKRLIWHIKYALKKIEGREIGDAH